MAETTIKKYLDLTGVEELVSQLEGVIDEKDDAVKKYAKDLGTNYDPAGTAATKVNELAQGAVKINTDTLATLTASDTTVGSIAKTVKDAVDGLKTTLDKKIDDGDSALSDRVGATESAINTLNGTGTGSVAKQVADAVAQIVNGAPDAYDTLVEISTWITEHAEDASAMNQQIVANKSDIKALSALVGALPEGTGSATLIEYIKKAVSDSEGRLTTAIGAAKGEAIETASSDATSKANTAESNAKKYADGLAKNYATAAQGTKADTAVQSVVEGTANGTIKVDGNAVNVHGLKSAAYQDSSAFDAAGAANTVKSELIGTDSDTAASNTIKGAKKYADNIETALDVRIDALEEAMGGDESVREQIVEALNALDKDDSAVANKYVSAVTQEDGLITVQRENLPDYSNTYDAKGSAATVKSEVIGTSNDLSTATTIYGTRKLATEKANAVLGNTTDAATANTVYGAKAGIADLNTRVGTLESVSFTAITTAEIDGLFAKK